MSIRLSWTGLALFVLTWLPASTVAQRAGSYTADGGRIVAVEIVGDRKVDSELPSATPSRSVSPEHDTIRFDEAVPSSVPTTNFGRRVHSQAVGFKRRSKPQRITQSRPVAPELNQLADDNQHDVAIAALSDQDRSRIQQASQQEFEQVTAVCADDGWSDGEVAYESFGGGGCECGVGVCSSASCDSRGGRGSMPRWSAGIEFAILKPHFSNNVAFTTIQSDGASFETRQETDFDYDSKLAPRIWIHASRGADLGLRFHYWQFNYGSEVAMGSPDASGFGRVFHPDFADIDLSTTAPGSVFEAESNLNTYVFDLEATKTEAFCNWTLMASAGLRFADIEQTYTARLINEQGRQQGSIFFQHDNQGIGPTFSLRAQRPFLPRFSLFGMARGSLVFGEGVSNLSGIEDQDLDTQFTTSQRTERDEVLPIGELQVGLQWVPPCFGAWQPYIHLAMEGQVWQNVGNAANEVGDLGLFGVNVALGFNW